MKRLIMMAVLLVPISAGAGATSADCDVKGLAKMELASGREIPTIRTRDQIFACTGVMKFVPKGWDELEKDLFLMRATHLDLVEYTERYKNNVPADRLKRIWGVVREFKAEKDALSKTQK